MATLKQWLAKPTVQFIGKTILYAGILLALFYLYGYRGVTGGHFIYNEF